MPKESPKSGAGGQGAPTPRPTSPITLREVSEAYARCDQYPPMLSLSQAADLAHLAPSTLKRKVSEGCFKGCVSRGKPLRIWRDRFVLELMSTR